MEKKNILLGLDVGSVSAKFVLLVPRQLGKVFSNPDEIPLCARMTEYSGYWAYISDIIPVSGDPFNTAKRILQRLNNFEIKLKVNITGSQAKHLAHHLNVPRLNEFKAIGAGVTAMVPGARTILEIGGDVSRYIKIETDQKRFSIVDYERNGECAAGTGSFLDQQSNRLKYKIQDIGGLVLDSKESANIAGRCSVFAKSDMVHAQQMGYTPGAILKGLCEAVVRNYKGTVLRGKEIDPKVVFVGGVAANAGVVQALMEICSLGPNELIVPEFHFHAGALGAALAPGSRSMCNSGLDKIDTIFKSDSTNTNSCLLDDSMLRYPLENSGMKKNDYPIPAYLGIDIGSVSTNFVLLNTEGIVIDEIYTRTEGRPIQVVKRELKKWQRKWSEKVTILGVGTTGSGRELVGELVGADVIHDEITAHKTGASFMARSLLNETVDTIFEIGGQDSKFISIDEGVVVDFTMNEACAAGTGSFLEEQSEKMDIAIKDEFAQLAFQSKNPVKMGERCTVFMEKDVSAYLQQGKSKKDIAAGLAFAVVQNYLNRVVRGRKIGNKIFFQGGTAYNKAVAAAFSTTLGKPIIVPPHNGVMGAIGAALLARDKMQEIKESRFRGFDLSNLHIRIKQIRCQGCSNQCDVQVCTIDGEKTYWGDKCSERFRKKKKTHFKLTVPDLVGYYKDLLYYDMPTLNGSTVNIGIPNSLYFFERLPFWKAYFSCLGAHTVLSPNTNQKIIKQGRDICVAEPCFPILVAHGHIKYLLDQNVDYIFSPCTINSETEFNETKSWFCPWAQTMPLMVKNNLREPQARKLLTPAIRFREGPDAVAKSLLPVAKVLNVSKQANKRAVKFAYKVQANFRQNIKQAGIKALQRIEHANKQAIVIIGRPYNIYDDRASLNILKKLREDFSINIIPMDFLPLENIPVSDIHYNMFWNYGKKILQAAKFVERHDNLHIIYFTNFKCGPDSYIKHFVGKALESPFLTLQFDDHSNDAGILTRCQAYLESKHIFDENSTPAENPVRFEWE